MTDTDQIAWPTDDEPDGRTQLTCGHFALTANVSRRVVGAKQFCEVCGTLRTAVDYEPFTY